MTKLNEFLFIYLHSESWIVTAMNETLNIMWLQSWIQFIKDNPIQNIAIDDIKKAKDYMASMKESINFNI